MSTVKLKTFPRSVFLSMIMPGDKFVVEGKEYEVVDRRTAVANDGSVIRLFSYIGEFCLYILVGHDVWDFGGCYEFEQFVVREKYGREDN